MTAQQAEMIRLHSRLSEPQRRVLQTAERATADLRAAEGRVEVIKAALHRAVYDALRGDVPARLLADRLGVSVSRIYQMRDIAEGFQTEPTSDEGD